MDSLETSPGPHLVDPSCYILPQSHRGMWGDAGGVAIGGGYRVFGHQFFEVQVFGSFSERIVGASHKSGG